MLDMYSQRDRPRSEVRKVREMFISTNQMPDIWVHLFQIPGPAGCYVSKAKTGIRIEFNLYSTPGPYFHENTTPDCPRECPCSE